MVLTQQEIMVTLIFGFAAIAGGVFFFMASYFKGFRDIYSMNGSKTIYDVITRTLLMHVAIVVLMIMFISSFEVVARFDIYEAIARTLTVDWFDMVLTTPANRADIRTAALLLGWMKLITTLLLAFTPVFLFLGIVLKQTAKCQAENPHGHGGGKGVATCSFEIFIPAIFFLTMYFVHISIASVLLVGDPLAAGADVNMLTSISQEWWRDTLGWTP